MVAQIVADALLPPACLAILALLLLLAGRRRLATGALALLILLSLEVAPHELVAPLLAPPRPAPDHAPERPPGAIVVVAGTTSNPLDPSAAVPGPDTLTRLRVAAALFRRTGLPVLVSGAAAPSGPSPVGAVMADSLMADFGVSSTWVETRSTNLWQGADAVAALLRPAGIRTVYLVAQPWEFRLDASVFAAAGLEVVPAPVPHAGLQPLALDALLPFSPVWVDSATVLRQWAGLACQTMPPCVAALRGRP